MTSDYPMGAECDVDALVAWRYQHTRRRVILGSDECVIRPVDGVWSCPRSHVHTSDMVGISVEALEWLANLA